MKKLILLFLFLISINAFSFYSTPGTGKNWTMDSLVLYSSGHVTYSNGAYQINDTLTISSSDTVFIRVNCTVKLGNLSLVNISGTFLVNPPQQALFTPIDTNQKYIGFYFMQYSDASVLRKSIFELGNGIKIYNSNILIDSCTIRNFTLSNNFSSGAINISNSSPVISNSTLTGNKRSAILSSSNGNASPTIINNTIYGNNTENIGAWNQINLGISSSSPIIIENNIIRGVNNQAGGISISTLVGGSVNCIIENNNIKNNRYGIAIIGNNINSYINNNIIDSNNTLPNPLLGGSGINFNGNSTQTSIVTRNKIRWNLWGITIQTSAKPDIGNLNNLDTSDNGFNYIYGNNHNDSTIDLYNNTPDSIMAQNNFWGTANLDSIEAHIIHKPHNPSLGFVNYIPIYLPNGIVSYSKNVPEQIFLYDAFPNPFNPVTKIRFSLLHSSKGGELSLNIYDILGRKVASLIPPLGGGQEGLVPGTYEIAWDGSGFSSGVYFYKLQVIGENSNIIYSQSKKLILLK